MHAERQEETKTTILLTHTPSPYIHRTEQTRRCAMNAWSYSPVRNDQLRGRDTLLPSASLSEPIKKGPGRDKTLDRVPVT